MIRKFTKYFIHNTIAFVGVRIISSVLLLILSIGLKAQVPTISSFSPASGPVNTSVIITGTNFDVTPTNNVVHFGATKAVVSNSSATELTVNVPFGASYQPITVAVNGLLSYSSTPFVTTFDGAGVDVISLADKVDISTGIQSSLVAMADLDDDGKADLIVMRSGISAIEVYRNISSGVGDISFDSKESFSSNVNPNSLDVGDFDGDGKIDVVVVGSTRVGLLRNINTTPGVMSFDDVVMYTTTETNWSVSTGDFDMDGKADLAVTSTNSSSSFTINKLLIYRNISSGIGSISYATPVEYTTNAFPYASSVGDFDNDGKPDIAVVNEHDNTLSIYRNTNSTAGTISFAGQVDLVSGDSPISVSSGDLDEDGKLDLAVANAADHTMSIFRNSSSGVGSISFDTKVDHAVGLTPRDVAIGDMDGDGKLDLSVANRNDNTVSVLKNITGSSGLISLDTKVDFATDTDPRALVLTDIDGDGRMDMAVPAYDGSTVSILRNTSISSLIAYYTFNGDATDQSGNANDGSASGATLTTDRFGNADAAYSFDGVDDVITLPFAATDYLSDAFTLSAWVYRTKSVTSGALQGIVSSAVDSNDGGLVLGLQGLAEGNRLMSVFNNDASEFSASRNHDTYIPESEWILCTATYDGSMLLVYENSDLVGSSSASGNLSGTGNLMIGSNPFNGIEDEFFGGSIDDVRIYDYALTETEVYNLYDIESGDLIVSYTFDGDATDNTGNGYDGTVLGALDTQDRFGSDIAAFAFDGDDRILAAGVPISTQEITIMGWFNTSHDFSVGYGTFLDLEGGAGLFVDANNLLGGVLQLGDDAWTVVTSDVSVNDGNWHHGALTFDGSQMILYLDGVEVGLYSEYSGDLFYDIDPLTLRVGYSFDGEDRYFNGNIDDTRYYSRALSASEISEQYLVNDWIDDRATLMSLYYNTDGDNWSNNTNWGTNEDLSTWYGITAESGVVSQLDLSTNNLVGEIPSELGNLSSLIFLNLFNNGLSGSIPSDLGNLSNLQELYLSVNDLSGDLPASLGNLSNATIISFSRNRLSGAIPSELVNLSSLSGGLFLYSNEFTSMPDMTAFPTGTTLSVYDNKIGFADIETNLPISSGSTFIYSPQTSGNEVTLYPAENESLTLFTAETYTGTTYQWYYNDEEISGANLASYTFNFTSALEGTYYVQMTNSNVPDLTINGANLIVTDGVNVEPSLLSMEFYGLDNGATSGFPVSVFSTTDVDPGDSHTFELVSGEGDTNNSLFTMDGRILRVAGVIDASAIEYSVRVRVTDQAGAFLESIFLLEITPSYSCDNSVFTELSGTITDGSGDFRYRGNFDCGWLVTLPSGGIVKLEFTEFDTELNYDFLYVYDGENDQAPLLATLSGSTLPESIFSNSESVYLKFVSDESLNLGGWSLDYSYISVTPVAYYPFDGDATDATGNGNDGIVTDATLANDRYGNADASYNFNGTSAYIQTGATISSNAPFTVSTWVRWDGNVTNYTEIVSWWNEASPSKVYLGTSASTGELRFGDAWINTGVYLIANQWENLVATYDGSVAKIYLNGELVATSSTNPLYDMSSGDLFVGRQGTQSGEFFGGAIDDIAIYDIALPASLISALYNDAGATDLFAYLPFRNSLEDASDNGFDGFQFGSSNTFSSDRVASPNDAAYNFEYENTDLVELSNTANYDFGDEITVTAWIRPDTYPTEEVKLISNVFEGKGFELRLITGDLTPTNSLTSRKLFADIAGISYGDIGEILLDRWTHVAFKYQRGYGASIYINGQNLITYGLVEGFEDSPILISPINVQIGNGYDGILDEVKIFKSALTDDEILLEYNEDVWPFDILALRGPDPGEADDNFLYVSAANSAYYNEVLDITKEGMYQFRATNTSTTLFEAFMGDNEGDGVAEPGGALIDLTTGIYGISFNVQNFEYFIEQVNTIGFIGSARTGDEDGWLEEDEMVDLGNGIYQIQNIKLFDGEWKLRMNNQWGLIDWGYSGTEGELFTFGNNIPISEGTYTITVDIINNKYYVIDTEIEYVAELAFDGDLLDTSGYENHGTGTLAFTTDRFGDANSAIDAQSVNIGSDAELNLSNGFSLNMWINPYSYDNNAGLFLSGSSFHQHLSEFDVAWRYFQDGTEKSFGVPLTAPINTWTMFTWVYDGGEMRFYDDGLLIHTEQVLGDIDTPGNSYEIGVGFDGSIDDFIWAKGVLDEYDILSLYNDGYVARYALDGGAIDEVNGYDGILNGSPTFGTDRFGSSGLAISLDGVDDYIDLGTDPTLHFEDEISLSAWVKADGSDPFGGIVSWSIGFTLDIRTDNGGLATFGSFGLSNDVMNSISNIQDGEWHHLVGTYGEGIKRLYVDGVLEAELTGITLNGTDPFLSTSGMTIGWEANSGYFEGQIDDVGIFDRAITGEEVLGIYSDRGWPFSANQVAHYTFTDGVTTSETGSYDGVATSNSLFSMDRFGQFNSAFEPEGNGGNISISHGGAWDMTGEVMLNGWVRPNQFPTGDEFGHIIFRDDVFGELDFNSSGELFYHWDTGGGNYSVVSTAADQIKHNQWNMVTLVISDADYVKIYVNGDLQKISQFEGISNADSILITRHSGVGAMAYLGSNLDAGSDQRWISGSIDDFRVYVNGSFSSNQILELYENELSGGSDELVAFFPFNGSSLSDESGNQYGVEYYDVNGNEIAANFTTDRYGETGAALLFDNTGNNAPVFHERSINLRNDFTVNLWINPASFITTGGDELGDVLISDSNLGRFMTFGDGILAYHYPSNNGVDYPTAATGENVVSLNTWQMVTYSINNNDQLSIYHNGVKLIDNSDVSDHQINLTDRFVIAQRDNAGGSDQRYYDGAIDDVGVYQRTLSDAEVEALYIAQDPFSSEAAIISFSFPSETGAAIINSSSNTIDIEVAIGTDLTNLVADFTISDGASVTVDGVSQVSNTTSNDFTGGSLTYTVTSRNGQVINGWVVSVSRVVNTDTDIISFKIADQVGDEVIDVANHTILINMPFETDPSSLTPTIELPFGATINPGSDIAQNFTNAFFYTVTAEDNNISQAWEVTVEVATISNEAPIIAAQTFDQLEENSAISTAVGTVVASDPDGDALTFSITGGTGSDIFTINASSGELLISDASKLNYEENPSFSLNVSVSDGALSTSAEMTINLVDVNDPATITNIVAPDSYTFGSGGLTISADIIDEDAITDVSLFYKKASETDFSSKQMDVSDNNYSQTLTGAEIGLIAVEYYIQITNATGTEETESQTATVERPTTSALSIDDKVTPGNSVSNYSILAFPFQSATVGTVFSELGTYDDSEWRLLRYNGTDYTDHKTGSLPPGTGYFFITTTEATIEISGSSVRTTDGEFALPLSDEYSLIGNPFQGTVNWSEVIQYNIDQGNTVENQVSDLIKFSNGVFVANQTSLSSLEGAFVKSDGAVSGFVIPVSAVTDTGGGRVAESLNAPEEVFIDNTSWNFDLFLETPDYTYSVGGIGMHQNANDADDALDLSPLPRFHIYIDVLFEDGNTRSVKETDRFKKWDFNVPSNLEDKYINMSWDIPVSTDKTIILVDGSSQQIYDLSQKRGIELLNDPSATHQLYFGNKEEIFDNLDLPFDAVFNLYPNPVRDYLNIELYAAEGRTTKVEFVSIDGKVAYTQLVDLQQGLNKKEIDLVGKSLAEGVYLIKIDAKTITKFIKL